MPLASESKFQQQQHQHHQSPKGKGSYWLLSFVLSSMFFFVIYFGAGYWVTHAALTAFFSFEFWVQWGWLCIATFITDIAGAVTAAGIVIAIYSRQNKPHYRFWDLTRKRSGAWKRLLYYAVGVAIMSFLFLIGAVKILQEGLFGGTVGGLVLAYLVVKFVVWLFTRIYVGSKI